MALMILWTIMLLEYINSGLIGSGYFEILVLNPNNDYSIFSSVLTLVALR